MSTHAYKNHLQRSGLKSKWPSKSTAYKKAQSLVKKSRDTLLPKEKAKNYFVSPPSPQPLKPVQKVQKSPEKAENLFNGGNLKNGPSDFDLESPSCKLKIKLPSIELTRIDEELPKIDPKLPKLTLNLSPKKGQFFPAITKQGRKSFPSKQKLQNPKSSLYFSENSLNVQNASPKLKIKGFEGQKGPKGQNSKPKLKLNLAKLNGLKTQKKGRKRKIEGQEGGLEKASVKKAKVETIEESLTCPTCDKIFMAKSILERHLLKSKHGLHTVDKDVMSPPPIISQALDKAMAEGRQLPHLNAVVQPKIEVGGRTVNKYECHLCNQVFLRVKDLAKHRERMMCAAYKL